MVTLSEVAVAVTGDADSPTMAGGLVRVGENSSWLRENIRHVVVAC